jgi:hypothetical protein
MGAPAFFTDGIRSGLEQAYRKGLVEVVDQELASVADKYLRMSRKQLRAGPIKRVGMYGGRTYEYRAYLRAPFVRSRLVYRLKAEFVPTIEQHELRFGDELLARYEEEVLDVRVLH